jgi:hypothetical protein
MSGPTRTESRSIHAVGVELLAEMAQIPTKHVVMFPDQLTAYDCYCIFIDLVKQTIPPDLIRQLQTGCEPDAPIEQILTPPLVSSLALTRLMRMIGCEMSPLETEPK